MPRSWRRRNSWDWRLSCLEHRCALKVFHQRLRGGLRGAELPARLCTDAHLVALTIANGWRLVSFDRDFERFEGLVRLPLP